MENCIPVVKQQSLVSLTVLERDGREKITAALNEGDDTRPGDRYYDRKSGDEM